MINGKVPEDVLVKESFTWEELREAVMAAPWVSARKPDAGFGSSVTLGAALRWLLEWVVQNKREPEYESGVAYQDARGHVYMLEVDSLTGETTGNWAQMGSSRSVQFGYPLRPLRKLVPETEAGPRETEGE